ncbi:MAG TPA: Jag N-terminal domain-containing protein, partial [Acidimicrobiales bacterium]
MEWVETTGRTVAAALDVALDTLGVDEDEVEFEVLEEGRAGLLGRRPARIRARVRPISRDKPTERHRRPRRTRSGGES